MNQVQPTHSSGRSLVVARRSLLALTRIPRVRRTPLVCMAKEERWDRVIVWATKVLSKAPNNAKALFLRGKAHSRLDSLDRAEADLVAAVKANPSGSCAVCTSTHGSCVCSHAVTFLSRHPVPPLVLRCAVPAANRHQHPLRAGGRPYAAAAG